MTRDSNAVEGSGLPRRRGSALAVAAAWAVVVLPAAWGITQTVRTSLRLFVPAKPTAALPINLGPTTVPSNPPAPTTGP